MKRILSAFVFMAIAFAASGCVKIEQAIIINDNNTAEIKTATLFDKRLQAYIGDEFDKALNKSDSKNQNVKVEKVDRGDYTGIESTQTIKDVEKNDIPIMEDGIKTYNNDGKFLSVKKNFFKNTYTIDADFNMTSLKGADASKNLDAKTASMFQYQLSIQIPSKAIFTNSTDVDAENNVYKWNIKFYQSNPVKLQYATYNYVNIGLTVAGVIILLLLLKSLIKKED